MADNKYEKSDAAKDTVASPKEVAEAWHTARDDAQNAGEIDRGSGPGEQHAGEQTEAFSLDSLKDLAYSADERED